MRTIAKTAIALGFVTAMAIGGTVPASAYYVHRHVWVGPHYHHYYGVRPYAVRPYGYGYYNYYGVRPYGYPYYRY